MSHGEILKADGTIYIDNLRSAKATDQYILKGDPNGGKFHFIPFLFFEI